MDEKETLQVLLGEHGRVMPQGGVSGQATQDNAKKGKEAPKEPEPSPPLLRGRVD